MKAKLIYCIIPFSRPGCMKNVVENVKRQTFKEKKVLVVENGDAVHTFPESEADFVLRPPCVESAAGAKNAALEFLKEKFGNVFWTTMDDDDYYGPKYMEELVENSDKGDIIGKNSTFMETWDGRMIHLDNFRENARVKKVWGYTISSWTEKVSAFPEKECGEDNSMLEQATRRGLQVYSTSTYHAMFSRHKGKHAWEQEEALIWEWCEGKVSMWNKVNLNIVNGKEKISGEDLVLKKNFLRENGKNEEILRRAIDKFDFEDDTSPFGSNTWR
jgi:hypothetical protein